MTQQEAWSLLVQVTGAVQTNRDVHEKIKEALAVLKPSEIKE